MARRRKGLLFRCRLVATLATLIGLAFYAQAEAPSVGDAKQRWQALNAQIMQAYQIGDLTKGVELAEKALGLATRTFGSRDPNTLVSLNNLAVLYRAEGRYEKAQPLLEKAVAAAREEFGPEHPDVATSLNNLALIYQDQGRYAEAVKDTLARILKQ
jgi:tetratricopeptide (TPR) repeat protein